MIPAVRKVLITGAGRRIGAVVAEALALDGWHVAIHYNRSAADAADLVARIRGAGGVCDTFQADFSNQSEIFSLFDRVTDRLGSLHCLINNAATFVYDNIYTLTAASLDHHLQTNLVAPLLLSQRFCRHVSPGEDACIINILDQKVANPNPDFLSYTVSKFALFKVTETLASALLGNVRVCGIAPGITLISGKQTEESFRKSWSATPFGRSSTPEEIVAAVRFILSAPSLTGQIIFIDGGESLRPRPRDVAFDPTVQGR